jgi:hypothetical protein
MDSLQEVITTKNEIIMDQERHIKNLNNEISKLHDSLIHEKIHASRVDDSLFEQNVNNRQKETEPQQRRAVNKQNQPDHNAELHQGRAVNINNRQNPPDAEPRQVDNKSKQAVRSRQERATRHRRKQVLFIGTSNIKYVSCRYVAGKRYYVHKETRYTIDDATEYVQNYDGEMKPEIIVYHLLCNDVEKSSNPQLLTKCQHLTDITKAKFPSCRIMISLGLPRGDREFNLRINTLNIDLQNHYKRDNSVVLCDNSNLFYRGMPLRGILRDQKHLSKQGVFLFSENLREELDCLE